MLTAPLPRVYSWALSRGEFAQGQRVVVMHGTSTLDAELSAVIQVGDQVRKRVVGSFFLVGWLVSLEPVPAPCCRCAGGD